MTIIHKRKIGNDDGQLDKKNGNNSKETINNSEMIHSESNEANSFKIKDGECFALPCAPFLPCNYCTIL